MRAASTQSTVPTVRTAYSSCARRKAPIAAASRATLLTLAEPTAATKAAAAAAHSGPDGAHSGPRRLHGARRVSRPQRQSQHRTRPAYRRRIHNDDGEVDNLLRRRRTCAACHYAESVAAFMVAWARECAAGEDLETLQAKEWARLDAARVARETREREAGSTCVSARRATCCCSGRTRSHIFGIFRSFSRRHQSAPR